MQTQYEIIYTLSTDQTVQVQATLADVVPEAKGVFVVSVTLEKVGAYSLSVALNGLQVPTNLDQASIIVTEQPLSNVTTTTFTGVS